MVAGTLFVDVIEVEHLKRKSPFKTVKAPYCSIVIAGTANKFKSKAAPYHGMKSLWNEKTTFSIDDATSPKLTVEVYDKDGSKEVNLGSTILDFSNLIKQEKALEAWFPIRRGGKKDQKSRVRMTLRFEPTQSQVGEKKVEPTPEVEVASAPKIVERALTATGLVMNEAESALEDEEKAALKIQALFRGRSIRKKLNTATVSDVLMSESATNADEDEEPPAPKGFFSRLCRAGICA
eukprot:CAMPEP_0196657848 /NCGR_PEP_ID=MMETSP1086-20130531/26076_1 /TAXON_ID=77921 /ORGANISM="Cyanoptyche  gloeocystis , Strain SAG4.97" /LENGTH=235 /DNA_ID=CAMNT_0041991151 /DNA_START=118 /DNA_END=825 /DNA_ORIENTATION=-